MLMMTKRSDYGPIMAEALGWVANPWLAWGLLPFLGANAGFWLCALPLELIVSRVLAAPDGPGGPLSWRFWFRPIEWSKVSRKASLNEVRERISFRTQVIGAASQICGPMAIVGALLSCYREQVMPV